MYVMAEFIYGIPITRKMHQWYQESDDAPDDLEELGFVLPYSGNSDFIVGYLGVSLAVMDEINPVPIKTDGNGNITGMVELTAMGTPVKVHSLKPTGEQVKQAIDAYNELPESLLKVAPPVGIYIVWSTS